jgi:MFS family permease
MLPLIIKPAIAALSAPLVEQLVAGGMPRPQAMALWVPGGASYVSWARTLFFVPAMVGGVFGLLGGYLTDRLGRRRVLTFSILLYAGSAFASGFVTSLEQLLVLRCAVFLGVCVEFVAAVAWLAELFSDPKQREGFSATPRRSRPRRHPGGRQRDGRHRHQPAAIHGDEACATR